MQGILFLPSPYFRSISYLNYSRLSYFIFSKSLTSPQAYGIEVRPELHRIALKMFNILTQVIFLCPIFSHSLVMIHSSLTSFLRWMHSKESKNSLVLSLATSLIRNMKHSFLNARYAFFSPFILSGYISTCETFPQLLTLHEGGLHAQYMFPCSTSGGHSKNFPKSSCAWHPCCNSTW